MNRLARRLDRIDQAGGDDIGRKPWRCVTVDVDETEEDVLAREGIGPDDSVIVRTIVEPREAKP